MSETEELKTRIETIRALSGQLRERNRTVKSLEEEMTATAPEHAWSFGKKHHYNLLKAELEDERRLVLEDKYRLGSLSKDLFEDFNIVADKATSTNSLESMLDPGHRPGIQGERQPPNRNNRWDVVHASRSAGQS